MFHDELIRLFEAGVSLILKRSTDSVLSRTIEELATIDW
jgi:hypothetical protein